ncbi:hypothetical protein LOCC1_G008877 [Lachnellula occidentalis]|uniref:Uncharacterized protein n=1 Tax=Lachnellula occidentalis TaxID=215460 RepID=A0A8H8U2A0_9HELO|nr:hypothetical protein LOCC1_G008877 [Lachnellula occidentalis]
MAVSILLRSLFLFSIVLAGPVEHYPKNIFEKRDPCDGVNAEPVLYHEYGTDKCPPKYKLEHDRCYHNPNTSWKCEQFCQLATTFVYGQEQPFANAYCHGPQTCTISSTETRTITWNFSFNPKFLEAYQVGITGGFSVAKAEAFARAFSIKMENGQCGYFTFVPVIKKTCGKIGAPTSCTARANVNEDVCMEQLHLNKDGSIDGETIFVRSDCATRMPLGKDKQDPVYQQPGVPLDRGLQESWASTWEKNDLDGMHDEDSGSFKALS